jgi:flagellar protein FliO/FliZ
MLELADLSRAIIGLGVVLLLMAVVFWLLRRFGPQGAAMRAGGGRRLGLVESLPIDPRTRLILVRQDEREHLLVVSSAGTASLIQTIARTGDPA